MMRHNYRQRFFISIFLICQLLLISDYSWAEQSAKKITVDYFYFNACETCRVEDELIANFNEVLGKEKIDVLVDLKMHNTFLASNDNLLQNFYDSYKAPDDIRHNNKVGVLFMGDTFIPEGRDFNLRLLNEFIRIKEALYAGVDLQVPAINESTGNASLNEQNLNKPEKTGFSFADSSGNDSRVVYFYVSPCSACEEVQTFMDTLQSSYLVAQNEVKVQSKLQIHKYDIGDLKNLEIIRAYFNHYSVPENSHKAPVVFLGAGYLQGEEDIQRELVNRITRGDGLHTLQPNGGNGGVRTDFSGYEAAGVFLTGLINGFNPCSLSMLLFFLSIVVLKNVNVLRLGLAYITGKFLAYFAIGTLFFNLFRMIDSSWFNLFQNAIKVILVLIIIALIVFNLKDYLAAKHENYGKIKLQLPTVLKKINHGWIKRISGLENAGLLLLVSFALGVFISVGEFLCTGQIYLATIIYVLHTGGAYDLRAAAYFLLYGTALIIPLFLLIIAIHKGKEIFDLSEAIRLRMPLIKLITASVFTVFGLIVIFLF